MFEYESGAFAGEIRPSRPAGNASVRPPLLRQAIVTGAIAGGLSGVFAFTTYYAANSALPLPWIRLGSLIAVFGPMTGLLLSFFVQLWVLIFDRLVRVWRGFIVIANPVTAGGIGGAMAGVSPGAFGVQVFGSYSSPFMGTLLIAVSLISGSALIAATLAMRARRGRMEPAPGDVATIAIATVIGTAIMFAVAAVVAPIVVAGAFARAGGTRVHSFGASAGAIAGALSGGAIGLYLGLVIAFGRSLRPGKRKVPG